MSASVPHDHRDVHALPSGGNGLTRVLYGIGMAIMAVGVLYYSAIWFAVMMAVIAALAAREWHRLVRVRREESEDGAILTQTLVTIAVIGLALVLLLLHRVPALSGISAYFIPAAFAVLAVGALLTFIAGHNREDNPLWHAAGVLYIGLATLALVALREFRPAPFGFEITLGLFLIVWSTDTGALVFGKLIGGPKMAPSISPKKTWAGTIGGSLMAMLVYGFYIALLSFPVLYAMLLALLLSIVAHLGDLLESFVKRRFGAKDSGGLIPGHGGALDRMDSTFAAAPVMALLVFGFNFNPLFGGLQ